MTTEQSNSMRRLKRSALIEPTLQHFGCNRRFHFLDSLVHKLQRAGRRPGSRTQQSFGFEKRRHCLVVTRLAIKYSSQLIPHPYPSP